MYFAILGKHPQISLAELQKVKPNFYPSTKKGIVLFDTELPEELLNLGGCIKSGVVVTEKELQPLLKDCKIIGIQEETIGKHFKRTIGIRRFKVVKINHTDKEIKEKGKEIINIDDGKYGLVEHYQNIPLYETIDFGKPSRSMNIGMMPSKLAHILINIGINESNPEINTPNSGLTIYDPFCGSGTTNFLANNLGYNTVGSDINITHSQNNHIRRQNDRHYNPNNSMTFFQQDINNEIQNPIFDDKNNIIITEGRLGPIITKKSSNDEIKNAQLQIQKLYNNFFTQTIKSDFFSVIVFTIPRYIGHDNSHEEHFQNIVNQLGYQWKSIGEIYQREEQQVGRKICIILK